MRNKRCCKRRKGEAKKFKVKSLRYHINHDINLSECHFLLVSVIAGALGSLAVSVPLHNDDDALTLLHHY